MASTNTEHHPTLSVSFRGKKIDLPLRDYGMTIRDVQEEILRQASADPDTQLKLLYQGKRLIDQDASMRYTLENMSKKTHYKILATGVSTQEAQALDEQFSSARRTIRVRDDLTEQGQAALDERKRLGQYMLQKAGRRSHHESSPYRFGRIETLPNLPDQDVARDILTKLANDPGILACLQRHQWSVGALAELYPDGNVGQSAVCVMGLNENKGQRILLRVRTDDLKGFRKMTSIRKVLYHELAHNVHSEHDDEFFKLMRVIERECTSMDWTRGAGLSSMNAVSGQPATLYTGGTYRLGGCHENDAAYDTNNIRQQPLRELAAQAALARMTKEEREIEEHCGCGRNDLFLPPKQQNDKSKDSDEMNTNE
ncbi:hypothetical protein MPSEU_000463100 [Mayamaea pseudoterrestris]|nr:hypothetical protein MPSEU_000463100 [Mayamaea pseudoterrestris]